jgi:site-specific DNA-methyltransferase (adenine-specific)
LPSPRTIASPPAAARLTLVQSDRAGAPAGPPPPWFESADGRFRLYRGDCLDLLGRLDLQDRVSMAFADPPYFLSNGGITCKAGRMVPVDKGAWDRLESIQAMHSFNTQWLTLCRALLVENGSIWVSGTRHVIHSVGFAMQQIGFKILNDITWEKPTPNLSCRYFTHATETVLWAAKSERSRHVFNYSLMRRLNGGKQMKSVWTLRAAGLAEKRQGKHPTQKPVALLERILLASSRKGDLVVDPFCGSGTTGIVASALDRRFVGVEMEEEYLGIAKARFLALEAARRG